MMPRSLLFVPGDSERKQARARTSHADALILDLEDSVTASRRAVARALTGRFLHAQRDRSAQHLWVRVNGPSSGELLEDLVAVIGGAPDGIMLPKVATPQEVLEVDHYLTALEQREGLARYSTRLLVIATETPRALLTLDGYPVAAQRLAGLTWGAEDLSVALGALSKVDDAGALTPAFQLARSLCLVGAATAGVQAIDGIHASFRDSAGLAHESACARRDGFTGKLAIHPDQVDIINAAFSPTPAEVEHAQRVVAAFAATAEAGVTSIEGRMVDRPHLVQAQRVLAAAQRLIRKPPP